MSLVQKCRTSEVYRNLKKKDVQVKSVKVEPNGDMVVVIKGVFDETSLDDYMERLDDLLKE